MSYEFIYNLIITLYICHNINTYNYGYNITLSDYYTTFCVRKILGEVFRINLRGDAHSVSIELEKQTVRFLDTYNTMIRQQTFKITNKSDHLLTYICMKNESVYEGNIIFRSIC